MLTGIISAIQTATGLTAYPLYSTNTDDQIVYIHQVISDDGAVSKHRLELRVISSRIADAEKYRKEIITALLPSGDNYKLDGVYSCQINGGGQLYDAGTDTVHTIIYFEYTARTENTYNE